MSTPHQPPGSALSRGLDVTTLTRPVDQPDLDRFIADSKATNKPWRVMTTGIPRPGFNTFFNLVIPVLFPIIAVIAILVMSRGSIVPAVWRLIFEVGFPWNLIIIGAAVLLVAGVLGVGLRIVFLIRSLLTPRWWWEAAYRLVGFAAANGLRYGHDEQTDFPGVIFCTGGERTVERRLTTTSGRQVEIGNYRYVTRGEDRDDVTVYGWGYVAIRLDRRLPHLLLDAKDNNRSVFGIQSSNLPIDLAPDQRLSLGGEFDEKFTLYAPSDYGRDAFQIFAPDLMALFIDRLGPFDVEIIDDTMFCYGSRFDLLNPATYDWLQELVETVIARTVRRTSRYRDDFALLEADPANRPPTQRPASGAAPDSPAPATPTAGFQLLPGFVLGPDGAGAVAAAVPGATAGAPPGLTSAITTPPEPQTSQPAVFAFAGDGPPQTADNTVAAGGRRLRRRRWGLWSIVALALIAFYLYNSFAAPLFGWPHLGD